MSKISSVYAMPMTSLLSDVENEIKGCRTLEEAAQLLTDIVFAQFQDSIVLARIYVTVPFGELPMANHLFVTDLANTHQIMPLIKDETLILSLLGTRGVRDNWNDRHMSKGHVGIPLASAEFIDKVPMIARLLKEVGLDLDWIDSQDSDMVTERLGKVSGVFYVEDATGALDHEGRHIIPAQDFVEENDIKTVFGVTCGYEASKSFVSMVIFCHETLEKHQAEFFIPLLESFRSNTASLVTRGVIFQ